MLFNIFSCASAKAERSLSSLYGVFLCVELGDPPSQDFMGPYQNATPLLYDCRFDMPKNTPPGQTVMGAYGHATPPLLKAIFRWFKFTLKPPYSIMHDKLRLAIWDTSFWTFWLKFGHKGP